MKPSIILPGLAAVTLAADIPSLLAQLPDCSVQCLVDGAAEHGCSPVDYECQCANTAEITKTASPCLVKAGCELKDIGKAAETVANVCAQVAAKGKQTTASAAPAADQTTTAAAAAASTDAPGAAARGISVGGVAVMAAVAAML